MTAARDREQRIGEHLARLGLDPVEVARPWFALRDEWQEVYDRTPSLAVQHHARAMLDYIDTQLGRLDAPVR